LAACPQLWNNLPVIKQYADTERVPGYLFRALSVIGMKVEWQCQ